MTKLQSLEKYKRYVANYFRDALRAQLEIWANTGDIEKIVGEIDGLDNLLQDLAVGCGRPGEVDAITDDAIVSYVTPLIQSPNEECES